MSTGIARSIRMALLLSLGVTAFPALTNTAAWALRTTNLSASLQGAAQKGLQGLQGLLSSEGLVGRAVPHSLWGGPTRGWVQVSRCNKSDAAELRLTPEYTLQFHGPSPVPRHAITTRHRLS
jgi:hypothetical protein